MDAEVGSNTTVTIETGDGLSLEAEYHVPEGAGATVVLSHPHPQYGGDMHNPLIDDLFRSLPGSGLATLRYNFRGVGRSMGEHDNAVGERLDAAAAFGAGRALGVSGPLVSVGWSFGADVSLSVTTPELSAWVAIAAPLAIVDPAEMAAGSSELSKLLIVPEHDQFRTPEGARETVAGWPSTQVVVIPGGDHFLMGRSQQVAEAVAEFVGAL